MALLSLSLNSTVNYRKPLYRCRYLMFKFSCFFCVLFCSSTCIVHSLAHRLLLFWLNMMQIKLNKIVNTSIIYSMCGGISRIVMVCFIFQRGQGDGGYPSSSRGRPRVSYHKKSVPIYQLWHRFGSEKKRVWCKRHF